MSNTQRIPEEWLQKLEGITPPEQEAKKDEPRQEAVETPEQAEHAQQAYDDADVRADEPLPADTTLKYICNDEGENIEVRYKIIRALKPGAFGMTYLAKRMADKGTSVVIKEFYPKGTARVMKSNRLIIDTNKSDITRQAFEDFKKEPKRIQALLDEASKKNPEHPQKEWDKLNLVVPLTDVFTCFGNHYYVMEHVEGNTLAAYMQQPDLFEKQTIEEQLEIIRQVSIAIRHLHSIHCVHQDLSPNNIMIHKEDGAIRVKIIDYGMSTTLYHVGAKSSYVRAGGTTGFSDAIIRNAQYKSLFDDKEKRESVKLIDIYSLGAILAYLSLIPYPVIQHRQYDWLAKYIEQGCGNGLTIADNDPAFEQKQKKIYNLIRELVRDATNKDLSQRIPSVDEFMSRIEMIQEVCDSPLPSEKSEPTTEGKSGNPPTSLKIKEDYEEVIPSLSFDERIRIKEAIDKTIDKIFTPPTPWYKKYRFSLILATIGIAALVIGILSGIIRQPDTQTTEKAGTNSIGKEKQLTEPVAKPKQPESTPQSPESASDATTALTLDGLTDLMGEAQTDAIAKEKLFDLFDENLLIMEKDGNENAFALPILKLYNNLKDNPYQIGKTHKVDSFTETDGKINTITLKKINP